MDNGVRPAGLVPLSTTTGAVPQYLQDFGSSVAAGTTTHHVTLYRAASGALVFSAGSIQWAWGLDQSHDGTGAPADVRMQQAQVNLFADMGAQPVTLMTGLVAATKSTDTTGPTTTITSPANGSTVANGTKVTAYGHGHRRGRQGGRSRGLDRQRRQLAPGDRARRRGATPTSRRARAPSRSRCGRSTTAPTSAARRPVNRTVTCPCCVYGAFVPATPDSGDTSPRSSSGSSSRPTHGRLRQRRPLLQVLRQHRHPRRHRLERTGPAAGPGDLHRRDGEWLADVSLRVARRRSPPARRTSSRTPPRTATTPRSTTTCGPVASTPRPCRSPAASARDSGRCLRRPWHVPDESFQRGQYYVDPVFTLTDTSPLDGDRPDADRRLDQRARSAPKVTAQLSKPITASTLAMTVKDANGVTVPGTQRSTTRPPAR